MRDGLPHPTMQDGKRPAPPALVRTSAVAEVLDETPLGAFHLRALIASGLGFFTDSYDLFIIGTATALLKGEWHLSTPDVSLVGSSTLFSAFLGAIVLGRVADIVGRRRVYRFVAVVMVLGAVASAFSPNLGVLIASRLVLGFGIGGDYPVSAVLMSEFSNRHSRGRLVSLLFSMQALGLVVGPIVGMTLLAAGSGVDTAWRLMLGLGALPAGAAVYFRRRIPQSPRFAERVQGAKDAADAAAGIATQPSVASGNGATAATGRRSDAGARVQMTLGDMARHPRLLLVLLGTAGSWFAFDYAYYGNTISTPIVLHAVDPSSSLLAKLAWTLIVFVVAALPGYILAFTTMDRIGHKRLQLIGFTVMGGAYLVAGAVPGIASSVVPFLLCYGISYFFAEFGPNTTTFVLPSELFPTGARTTAHGTSAGVAKAGACIGVFAVPVLIAHLGLRGSLLVSAGAAGFGLLFTLLLPEPAGRALDEVSGEHALLGTVAGGADAVAAAEAVVGGAMADGSPVPAASSSAAGAPTLAPNSGSALP